MEQAKSRESHEEGEACNDNTSINNSYVYALQSPYELLEQAVRAIKRCLGLDDSPSSTSTAAPTTTTTTTTVTTPGGEGEGEGDGEGEASPYPTEPPQSDVGGDVGGDIGSEVGGEGSDLPPPIAEPFAAPPATIVQEGFTRKRPTGTPIKAGRDPQIH